MSNIFRSDKEIDKIKQSKEFKRAAEDKQVNDFLNNPKFQEFKDKYDGKPADEIIKDAKNVSKKLKEQYGEEEYKKKIDDLKNFERFLNPEQKRRMKEFLDKLE